MQPRKKLGTNLGPAPAVDIFAPTVVELRKDEQAGEPPAALEPAQSSVHPVTPRESDVILPPANPPQPEPVIQAAPPSPPKKPVAAQKKPATASASEITLPKRIHGTFATPYQRRTDGAQTRQTTLTVPIDLDDRFETFYRRQRGHYRTRSMLWAAAMEYFLDTHGG